MGSEDFSEKIRQHIHQLVKTAGLPDTEESLAEPRTGLGREAEHL
ncbi:MAG: hypothetical protein U5P10_05185 [Spirochaetia bacterium]|nr:hypothetical protein [Spirochaetia bacterium]